MDTDRKRQEVRNRRILLENYQHPANRGLAEDPAYLTHRIYDASDADDLTVQMRIEGGKIAEVRFDGNACPLCVSSASLMVSALTGRTVEVAGRVLTGLCRTPEGERSGPELPDWAAALDEARRRPGRRSCVSLPWRIAGTILEQVDWEGPEPPAEEKRKQTDRKTV
jgi:nitrogen fixation NifU-like protein